MATATENTSDLDGRLEEIRQLDDRLVGAVFEVDEEGVCHYINRRTVNATEHNCNVLAMPVADLTGILPNRIDLSIRPENTGDFLRQLIDDEIDGAEIRSIRNRVFEAFGDGEWSYDYSQGGDGSLYIIGTMN